MPVSVRKPRAIVFDILGTASKSGFLERILFPFLKVNLENYVGTHWSRKEFIRLFNRIQEQSIEFNKQEPTTPVVQPHESAEARASLTNFINFVTENGINSPAVTQLRFKVWFEGYQQAKIRTPIYSDVPTRMRQWFAESIKFYVFSNTWVEAQKALLKNTNHGDLTNLISGHYDNDFGALVEPDSWRRLCTEIRENPNDVLVLTKSPVEATAAAEAGLSVVLVLTHRHNVKAVPHEIRQRFPYVRTLNDLTWLEGETVPSMAQATQGSQLASTRTPLDQHAIATATSTGTSTNNLPLVSGATQTTQATGSSNVTATGTASTGTTSATAMARSGTGAGSSTSHRGGAAAAAKPQSSHSHSKK